MRIPSEITERMKANFRVLYDSGVPPYAIASRWGVSPKIVVDALGLPSLKDRRAAMVRKIEDMYQHGMSKQDIALETGRSIQNIHVIISNFKKRQAAREAENE